MRVLCIYGEFTIPLFDKTKILSTGYNPIEGNVYTVKSISSNGYYELEELPISEFGTKQMFSPDAFIIIGGHYNGKPIQDNTKPNTSYIPPVIVGIPGT